MRVVSDRIVLGALLALAAFAASAQVVYKCKSSGSVVYSNEPCLGAKVVDTTPTQGLDKSSGRSVKGADVSRSETRKAFADAIKPLTGMDAAQLDQAGKRQKLETKGQRECAVLDRQLPAQVRDARASDKTVAARAEIVLFESRKRFRELGC
jgi:hypothetical protein